MQEFYKKALLAFILIVLADALLAAILVERSYLSASILPPGGHVGNAAVRWQSNERLPRGRRHAASPSMASCSAP